MRFHFYRSVRALDLDLLARGRGPEEGALPPAARQEAPGQEPRGTDKTNGRAEGGTRPSAQGSEGARGRSPATAASSGGPRPRGAALAARDLCATWRGALPCQRGGRAGRPRAGEAPGGPCPGVGAPGQEGPAQALETARKPFSCRRPGSPALSGAAWQGTPEAGTAPGADGGGADAATCRVGEAVPLLDKRHSIPSLSSAKKLETRILEPLSEAQVFTNFAVKINPRTGDFVCAIAATRDIFKGLDVEAFSRVERAASTHDGSGLERSARRAKALLMEYIDASDLDLFFTLTLAPDKIDRYDYKSAVRAFGTWADNRVRRRGMRYVAVPELHRDGAIHFHGLCNAEACKLADSGRRDRAGRKIWNVVDWKIGFTTAVKLDGSREAVAHYVAKYIVKQWGTAPMSGGMGGACSPHISSPCGALSYRGTIGGRYFFHGGALRRYHIQHFRVRDWDSIPGEAVEVEGLPGLKLKYLNEFTQLSKLAEAGILRTMEGDRLDGICLG